jgi:hypothetical protein
MATSLATTQLLSQQLASINARQSMLQLQINDLRETSQAAAQPLTVEAVAERVEASLRKSLRTSVSSDVREAVTRERLAVEDRIVQGLTAVSDDLSAEQRAVADGLAAQARRLDALAADVARLAAGLDRVAGGLTAAGPNDGAAEATSDGAAPDGVPPA